jgi:Domain of unknown function (DUF5667)
VKEVPAVNASVFHRRRAERFAQLLDEAGGARRHAARATTDPDLTGEVALGRRLARIDVGVRADPEFRDGLRAVLMATIERDGIGAAATDPDAADPGTEGSVTPWLPIRSRRARGAIVIGLTVGTLAVSGMSAASGDASPGNPLYGMKRSTEQAQLALSSSLISRGQLYLEFAKTRMNEAATMRGDAPGLTGFLDDMDDDTKQGVKLLTSSAMDRNDPAALAAIESFSTGQRQTVMGMIGGLSGPAHDRTVNSLGLLDRIDRRVVDLRGALRCGGPQSRNGGDDDLGPLPHSCPAPGATRQPAGDGSGGAPAGRRRR